MISLKGLLSIASIITLTGALIGCGTTDVIGEDRHSNGASIVPEVKNTAIWAGELEARLEKDSTNSFVFIVQNHKTIDVTLMFPSSQVFDFSIINIDGEVIYTYSSNKRFMQTSSEKILKPGEILETKIDLSEPLSRLDKGEYTLNVVLSVSNEDIQSEVQFSYDGNEMVLTNLTEPVVLPEVYTKEVRLVGMIDNQSFEVMSSEGETIVLRISAGASVGMLPKGTLLEVEYFTNDQGQNIVELIIQK